MFSLEIFIIEKGVYIALSSSRSGMFHLIILITVPREMMLVNSPVNTVNNFRSYLTNLHVSHCLVFNITRNNRSSII